MDNQSFFHRVEGPITRGHRLSEGGNFKRDVRGKFFHTENGECLECADRGGGGSRFYNNVHEA